MGLTQRLLTSISSFPTGTALPRAVLKNFIPFVPEYVIAPGGQGGVKTCASPAGIRTECAVGSLKLEHLLSQYVVDIYLLSETFLNPAGLTHSEATAIQVTLASKLVLILAAYLSPSRPLIGEDLTACFGGGIPVLMAGNINAKHVDWNSRLNTKRGKSYVITLTRTLV